MMIGSFGLSASSLWATARPSASGKPRSSRIKSTSVEVTVATAAAPSDTVAAV